MSSINKLKASFIMDTNNLFIDMLNPLYKPDIKDMFTVESLTEFFELESSFNIYLIEKDIFKSVSSNLQDLKNCFLTHYNKKLSYEEKSTLIKKNSIKRLDEFDIEEYIEKITHINPKEAVKNLFKES